MAKSNFVKSVGKAITRQRHLAGDMTQAQLAEKLGVNPQTVSRMETGATPPALKRLEQMAEVLGCPVERFFWYEKENTAEQAEAIANMLRHLPPERRKIAVHLITKIVQGLEQA